MAREGLRVLVVSKKSLTEEQYQDFEVTALHEIDLQQSKTELRVGFQIQVWKDGAVEVCLGLQVLLYLHCLVSV